MTTMSKTRTACPDLEQLAAFIDGCLDGDERREVVEHLEGCQDCYALFTDTIRLQEDAAIADPDSAPIVEAPVVEAPVVEHPSSRGVRWWLTAAAVAAVVLITAGAFYWLGPLGPPQPFEAMTLAERAVGGELEASWLVPYRDWPTLRDIQNDKSLLTPEQRWFQLGVESVALSASLAGDQREAALEHLASQILPLLNSLEFGQPLAFAYSELLKNLEVGASREHLLSTAAVAAVALLHVVDRPAYYSLGQWAQAGRLAALTEQRAHFKRRSIRRYPERLAEVELTPELRRELTNLEKLLKVPSRQLDLVELAAAFERVINVGGGG